VLQSDIDTVLERKISYACQELNPDSLVVQPTAYYETCCSTAYFNVRVMEFKNENKRSKLSL
jgi:hypothetical protein